jgi:hypothetical protein
MPLVLIMNAVGVDHDRLDRLLIGITDHRQQLRVYRRLAAGDLQHVWDAFEENIAVDHLLVGGEIQKRAARSRFGKAHGALKIATGGYFHERNTGMLLVLGANAAVERAALVRLGAVGVRQARRLAEFMPVVIGHVGTDEILKRAVLGTRLAEINPPSPNDDLGLDQPAAPGTQAARTAEEGVIAEIHEAPRCS